MPGLGDAKWQDRPLPDHVEACATVLEKYARKMRHGGNVEDLALELLVIVRIMARRP